MKHYIIRKRRVKMKKYKVLLLHSRSGINVYKASEVDTERAKDKNAILRLVKELEIVRKTRDEVMVSNAKLNKLLSDIKSMLK